MEERVVWRYRYTPLSPLELVVELIQVGETLIFRRLFEGDVVKEAPITPEQAGFLSFLLLGSDWHME